MAPLERFLGCIYMRRHLQRVIQEAPDLTALPITEPGVIPFRYALITLLLQRSANERCFTGASRCKVA